MKTLLLAALLAPAFLLPAQGQWQLIQQHPTAFYGIWGIDAQHLWLSGNNGEFFHSTDGGVQVQMSKIPDSYSFLNDIAVWNDSLVLIGGGCYFPFDLCPGNIVLSTGGNGANWQLEKLDTLPYAIGVIQQFDLHPDGQLYGLSDYGGIYHSSDLGENWTALPPLPPLSIDVYSSVQFIDDQVGYMMGSKYNQPNGQRFRLFKTVNGGLEWTLVLEFDTNASGHQHIFHFMDAETGFVPGDAGVVYKTTDGGQIWTPQQVGTADEQVHRIQFADNQTGYLTTFSPPLWQSKIYRSTDGGQNWSTDLTVDTAYVSDMHFYDAGNGYAVSQYGHIYARSTSNSTYENSQYQKVTVFPNPAGDSFQVRFEPSENTAAQFTLYDAQGRLVLKQMVTQPGETIGCADLPAGAYFYLLTEEQNGCVGRGKIVVK